jgi:hypothetical protein
VTSFVHRTCALFSLLVLASGACAITVPDNLERADASGTGGSGGGSGGSGGAAGGAGAGGSSPLPRTCAEAAAEPSYLGCEFYPTVVANPVWSIFDFALLVVNPGSETARVHVERGGASLPGVMVEPGTFATIYLPWIAELKGDDFDTCATLPAPFAASVTAPASAYRVTSDLPLAAYQFSALEPTGEGGPPGKTWASCPGDMNCAQSGSIGCLAFSNEGSLLLPSTSLGKKYLLLAHAGWPQGNVAPTIAITGTAADTKVTVTLSATAEVLAGGTIGGVGGGGTFSFLLGNGDVVELAGSATSDFAGSIIDATHPVQVIAGMPFIDVPTTANGAGHVEEPVPPAAALGKHYFIPQVTGPDGQPTGQEVRLVGQVDGTSLTYPAGAKPSGAPAQIGAGEVVDLGVVSADFELRADQPIGVTTFTRSAPDGGSMPLGRPAASVVVPVEQYLSTYAFAAPAGYDPSYVDVVAPVGAEVTLDGITVAPKLFRSIGTSGFGVARVPLASDDAHVLRSDRPVGAQVAGYAVYTSYRFPAGMGVRTEP